MTTRLLDKLALGDGFAFEERMPNEGVIQLPTEEEFKTYDRRTCECEKPMVWRSAMPMAGTGVLLRMCCLAKEVERLTGLPPGTFYQVFAFEPTWEWDCDGVSMTEAPQPDGSKIVSEYRLASPPLWIEKRLEAKGLPIHNQVVGDKRKPVLLRQWRVDRHGNKTEIKTGNQRRRE